MNETKMIAGALSNDLFRVASLKQRGAEKASRRFLVESRQRAIELQSKNIPGYLRKVVGKVLESGEEINMEHAENFLMYGVLLQNYVLHFWD